MKTRLTKPCGDCPFLTTCPEGWLGEERAESIAAHVMGGGNFACHKTTVEGARHEEMCAGAMIMLEHQDQPNGLMRVMERCRAYDPKKMDMTASAFEDPEHFIEHHTGEK